MKHPKIKRGHLILFLTALFPAALLLQSYSSGPAFNNTRATGAPGDGVYTCVSCHNSGGPFGPLAIDVEVLDSDSNSITEYIADSFYTVAVTVNHSAGSPAGFGFQMICLENENHDNLSGWSNPSANAKLSVSAGRNYVEHNAISTSNVFTVKWKAPQSGTGSVTFYVGANAVNGNGGNTGDNARLTSLVIDEVPGDTNDTATGIGIPAQAEAWTIYPNPVHDVLYIRGAGNRNTRVYHADGREVFSRSYKNQPLYLHDLPKGYYIIRIDGLPGTRRFVKL